MEYDVPTRWPSAFDMLHRALYLQPAVDAFIDSIDDLSDWKVTLTEWQQARFLLDLLSPFNSCSQRLEQTTRPGIDKVFPAYETLFNELDRLTDVLVDSESMQHRWMKAVHPALVVMKHKLKKYYGKTHGPHVYANSLILNPRWKLSLFQQDSWEDSDVEKYRNQCREKFMKDYDGINITTHSTLGQKRTHSAIEDHEDDQDSDEDYENLRQSIRSEAIFNEYDHYVQLPRIERKIRTLEYWHQASQQFPKLHLMARDYLAVPATGAGVERVFSGSGRVVTAGRSRLNATTISDIMMYKDHLVRQRKELEYWKGAGMRMGEDIVTLMPVAPGVEIPKEWKAHWWSNRLQRFAK